MPVEEAVEFAARRGLAGLAVSDHDSMEMVGRARRRAASLGLTVIPAAELSCIDPDTRRKVHLLVYAPSRPEVLEPHFRLLAGRRRRVGEEIIGLVCRLYPVKAERIYELARESGTIYRVHILRALMELGYANTIYGPLYGELFGKPEKMYNFKGTYSHLEIDSDDLSVYIAQYPTLLCEVHLDYFGREYRRSIELLCKNGTVTADFGAGTLTLEDGTVQNYAEPVNERYLREMAYFLDYAQSGAGPSVNTPETALDVLKLTLGEL